MSTTRRDFLGMAAGAFAIAGLPHAVFAAVPGERRFVVVLLRGALDGLASLPPIGDPHYAEKRGALALAQDACIPLDPGFALNPGLKALEPYYRKGELLLVPAAGNGYRTRSHFDGQDLMECGLSAKTHETDGWLNRALALLQPMSSRNAEKRLGLAVGGAVPLLLRGAVPVASWEPAGAKVADADFVTALGPLYAQDALFGPALQLGLKTQNFSDAVLGESAPKGPGGFGPKAFAPLAGAAGKLLAAEDGPRIAALEMYGWDTHVAQGTVQGRLYENLAGLAEGFDALAQNLGASWQNTVVIATTEFGRTVAVNGTNGTDHGTGTLMFVMGGAVRGGRIYGDWPGLAQLEENRDLRVATDSRSIAKGILRDHLGIDLASLNAKVFPDAASLKPAEGLLRA
ncbi:MAG TPA: DUF1501 domain-containing protein [Stellaceae bacterium]|nr:DUF1501 domain-containing protein [Stellaceae bacterium]